MAPSRRIPDVQSQADSVGARVSPNSRDQVSSTSTGRARLSGVSPGTGSRNGSKDPADIPPPSMPFANSNPLIPTPSSSAITNYSPTAAPSQVHDYKIPVVVVCISIVFTMTITIIFVIRRSRKIPHVQTGETQSAILSIDTPLPSPTRGEAPDEQQLSSYDSADRSLPSPITKRQRTPRDRQTCSNSRTRLEINSPLGSLWQMTERMSQRGSRTVSPERSAEIKQQMMVLHEQMQRLSGQIEHLQRQLEHADGIQSLSNYEEPPAYVQL